MVRSGTVGSIEPIEAKSCRVPKPTQCCPEEISLSVRRRTANRSGVLRRHAQEEPSLRCGKQRSSKPQPVRHRYDADELPGRVQSQCFFCVSPELGRTLWETGLDGSKTGDGFFGCFGFFASRLLRN
jgi:hypothetical protein